MDVTVGESVILPCQVQHDPILDISFTWYFNGTLTDFKKDASHFEKVGGVSCEHLFSCRCIDAAQTGLLTLSNTVKVFSSLLGIWNVVFFVAEKSFTDLACST